MKPFWQLFVIGAKRCRQVQYR